MKKNRIKDYFAIVAEMLRFVIIIPLAPLVFGLVFFFAWCLGKAAEMQEDLDEQVRLIGR